MIEAAKLAGTLAAHGIWSVSDGAVLIPMLGEARLGQPMHMTRLVFDDLAQAVERGRAALDANESDADDGVLVYDARITLEERKIDALILELRTHHLPWARATLAVPYTPAAVGGRFAVHRPKLIEWKDCEDFDVETALDAFWQGVDGHEQGAKVWNDAMDQSL